MDFSHFSDREIINIYSGCIKELKRRKIIRTNNVLGELGEYIVIDFYNKTPGLPNLSATEIGTKNIDAISRNGERYSIKSTHSSTTGTFFGLEPKGSDIKDKQLFEYLVVCVFDDDCEVFAIYEISWEVFIKYKHWHSRMNAWNLILNKEVKQNSKILYEKSSLQ